MDNLLSYCGLVDARISTSEKDLPVQVYQTFMMLEKRGKQYYCQKIFLIFKISCDNPRITFFKRFNFKKPCHLLVLGLKSQKKSAEYKKLGRGDISRQFFSSTILPVRWVPPVLSPSFLQSCTSGLPHQCNLWWEISGFWILSFCQNERI